MMVATPRGPDHAERLFAGFLHAQGLEGILNPAAGQLLDRFDRVGPAGVDHVGGAEMLGHVELRALDVDRDDAPGAGDGGAVDGRQADAAAADHRHRAADLDLGGVDHRAEAGGDAAADQRGPVERHVVADFDQGVLVDQHVFGERRQREELVHVAAVLGHARGLAVAARDFRVLQLNGRPVVQYSQWPQNTDRQVMTWSPGLT